MGILEQTKGKIKLEGQVVGINNENSYREGFTQKDDSPYKSLSFFVQTSPTNRIKVEMFGMEKKDVYFYSSKEKKSKAVPWAKRDEDIKGYKILGNNLFLEGTGEKKTRKVLVEFDSIDYILEHVKDGDSVRVGGEIDFQQYENGEGELTQSTKFTLKSIAKIDDIDFEAEDFKEVSQFEQEIVVTDTMVDSETKKLIISANIIKYKEEVVPTVFVLDGEKYPKLANNMSKRLSFGDFIKVYGLIKNETIQVEDPEASNNVEEEDDWGGDDEIVADFDTNYITEYINELQIISVDSSSYDKGKYTEDDFLSDGEDAFDGEGDFNEDDEEGDIDDLPFG